MAEEDVKPTWFDADAHLATAAGIVRRSDHALLAADGRPASGALRAIEDEQLAAAKARRTKKED